MDEFDEELITNIDSGVIKYTALAKKINAPLSTVHFRIKKLEKDKIIKYYKGEVDWKKAGFTVTAFVLISVDINLLKSLKRTQDMLLRDLLGIIYVREGYITTSEADLILKVIAKDTTHFKEILLDYIHSKAGIINTKTMIVLG
ncbi:MAG: Lrp/AsnC family transcriptional regulator [Candidatus Marsarchaeota archaeon]|jgi:DNA-binding Lrp family transcriptional regulator|nr:Lrp/AsnC family transcriptional regulator [Candidatus Marsarchaeota archaeon]